MTFTVSKRSKFGAIVKELHGDKSQFFVLVAGIFLVLFLILQHVTEYSTIAFPGFFEFWELPNMPLYQVNISQMVVPISQSNYLPLLLCFGPDLPYFRE